MFLKRTSPNLMPTLVGSSLEIGEIDPFHAEIIPLETKIKQAKPCGTCDHDVIKPVFYTPPEHHKPRPSIINEALRALESSYFNPKKLLAKLFKKNKIKKSPRREAIIRVLQVMLQFMDMETLEVGFYDNDGHFIRLDVEYIAKQAKITLIRAKRALGDILASGYLEVSRQVKKLDSGRYISFASIRKFTVGFFMDLGVDHFKFFSAREWKRKRNEKKLLKQARGKFKNILKSVTTLAKKSSNKNQSLVRKTIVLVEDTAKALQKAFKQASLEE